MTDWIHMLMHLLNPRKKREVPGEAPEHLTKSDLDRLFEKDAEQGRRKARLDEYRREGADRFALISGGPVGAFARTSRNSSTNKKEV